MRYLPPVLQEYKEFQQIMDTEQIETEKLWGHVENAMRDQFLKDATENGVERWEQILDITPKATETLEERKFRIFARLNIQLPYTMTNLKQQIETLCGAGGYSVTFLNETHTLQVRIKTMAKSSFEGVKEFLERVVPVNLLIDLSLKYNEYKSFGAMTHNQMKVFTHEKLRIEVIEQ